ncbi:hypothetical protein SASPL_112350 [Salvia splendens]|uniref:Tubby C-terminal domain-containing protein n=1 Tax=Salvia splendens TaxID=180675 RepID=A0A8X8YE63_SALSN|nr:hypothetical protein SASPL_112350 [Salvia splendens]
MNGSTVNPYSLDCFKDVTKRSSKPLKRHVTHNGCTYCKVFFCPVISLVCLHCNYYSAPDVQKTSTENSSNQGTQNLCKPAAEVLPYKQLSNDVPSSEDYQVNATLGQTSYRRTFCNEQVAHQQVTVPASHLFFAYSYVDVHDVLARSNIYMGESGAFEPSMTSASQLPVNNTLGPHCIVNSYSFSDRPGKLLSVVSGKSTSTVDTVDIRWPTQVCDIARSAISIVSQIVPLADDGKFLLSARKCRRPTCTDYMISLHADDTSKGSETCVGKLRSNFLGTKLVVFDALLPHSGAKMVKSWSTHMVGSKQISPKPPAGNYTNGPVSVSAGRVAESCG